MDLPTGIKCPCCDGVATAHEVGGMLLEICKECGGVWFGSNQLKHVLAEGPTALDSIMQFEPNGTHESRRHASLLCPICAIPLHTNMLAGAKSISVQTCYGCAGLFLEGDALRKLDEQSHDVSAQPTTAQVSPEAMAIAASLDAMTLEEQRRTQLAYACIDARARPYMYMGSWRSNRTAGPFLGVFPRTDGLI